MGQDQKIYIIVNNPSGGTRLTSKNWAKTIRDAAHDVALVTFLDESFSDHIDGVEYHCPLVDVIGERSLPRPIKLIMSFTVMAIWFFKEKPKRIITIGMPITIGGYIVSFWHKMNRSVILDTHISAHLDYKSKQKTSLTFRLMALVTHNRWIYKKILSKMHDVIGISQSVAHDAMNCYGVHNGKISVVPPLIEKSFFESDMPQKRPRNKILYVGRLSDEKNIGDALKVMQMLVRDNCDFHLDIVGGGDMLSTLERQVGSLSLEDHVTFHGARSNISDFHGRATMQILTSHYEGFPLVLVEAMANGVPCVTYDGAFSPNDFIDNDVNGFVVRQYDVKSLRDAILQANEKDWDMQDIRDGALEFHSDRVKEKIISCLFSRV